MKIPFTKYHANGNDFILVLDEDFPEKFRGPDIISHLCRRRMGIGADGMFIISSSKNYDFFLDYYNADGSWETLCANGSRCAVHFMYNKNLVGANLMFGAGDGEHRAKILKDGDVLMSLKIPKYKSGHIVPEGVSGFFVDSGARHFVCQSKIMDDDYVFMMGKKIRNSDIFQPRGINVNFYCQTNNNCIEIKTYEKGVERVMLSCASGSAAVVFHLSQLNAVSSPTTTQSVGGKLTFIFDEKWGDPWVRGPAEHLFWGEFETDILI